MRVAVIGGKLQGVEAVYLAKKAGWKTLVIDKNQAPPAKDLCDDFLEFEISSLHPFPQKFPQVDFILPAIEDTTVLAIVKKWAKKAGIPMAFDFNAYTISCSKLTSDALFRKLDLPAPAPWPKCGFPVVIKPDQASGSVGVEIFEDAKSLFTRFKGNRHPDNVVVQEYLEGPSYSLEVVGKKGEYRTLQVTDLGMDDEYDCNRVTAPSKLPESKINQFKEMGLVIAKEIQLEGIMDVEVIMKNDELKLLEIDARLPSQTPIAVYWSTGINMVEILGHMTLNKTWAPQKKYDQFACLEHIKVCDGEILFLGEHIMPQDGSLQLKSGFCGADEAITSFKPGKEKWVATMIFSGDSQDEINAKRRHCYLKIMEGNLNPFEDQIN
ncbi:MAG: 3-methylornithine--L-lysine ligase PylC [Desulfobacteraceae bacterium]|nr:3-methylornithine--L-lysine ligase PylC [Desulfobacteraceae bacterium]